MVRRSGRYVGILPRVVGVAAIVALFQVWFSLGLIGTLGRVSLVFWRPELLPWWVHAFFAVLAALIISSCRAWLHKGRRASRTGCCRECGYTLTGNVSGVCPECGTRVARGD